jgi:hypothetical protein
MEPEEAAYCDLRSSDCNEDHRQSTGRRRDRLLKFALYAAGLMVVVMPITLAVPILSNPFSAIAAAGILAFSLRACLQAAGQAVANDGATKP